MTIEMSMTTDREEIRNSADDDVPSDDLSDELERVWGFVCDREDAIIERDATIERLRAGIEVEKSIFRKGGRGSIARLDALLSPDGGAVIFAPAPHPCTSEGGQ